MTKTNWKIILHWVKAHVGKRGNELSDIVAKEAAANKTSNKATKGSQKV